MNFRQIVEMFTDIGQRVIPLLAVVAFLVFILGVARFIRASANDKDFAEKKKFLIWGTVGLFVMFSIWGIISFLSSEFGFGAEVGIPLLPTRGYSSDSTFIPDPNYNP